MTAFDTAWALLKAQPPIRDEKEYAQHGSFSYLCPECGGHADPIVQNYAPPLQYQEPYLFGFKCDGIKDYETEVDEFFWNDDDQPAWRHEPAASVIEPCGWKYMFTEPKRWGGDWRDDL